MATISLKEVLHLALTALRQDNFNQAKNLLLSILNKFPEHSDSIHYLGIVYHKLNDITSAENCFSQSLKLGPNNPYYWHNHGIFLMEINKIPEAINALNICLKLKPDLIEAHGNLARCYYAAQQFKLGIQHGQRCLELKDDFYTSSAKGENNTLNSVLTKPYYKKTDYNIISFSLWGDKEIYTIGAIKNAEISPYVYPEWHCRFYCEETVSNRIVNKLRALDAEVIIMPKSNIPFAQLGWRFLVADDDKVTRFICRDCDSRLNFREKYAVDDWILSGKYFHIMRVHIMHCELILAGLWGGIPKVIPDFMNLWQKYSDNSHSHWRDQAFLRAVIWPLIRDQHLTHDSHYQMGNTKPFPPFGSKYDLFHIGSTIPIDKKDGIHYGKFKL